MPQKPKSCPPAFLTTQVRVRWPAHPPAGLLPSAGLTSLAAVVAEGVAEGPHILARTGGRGCRCRNSLIFVLATSGWSCCTLCRQGRGGRGRFQALY